MKAATARAFIPKELRLVEAFGYRQASYYRLVSILNFVFLKRIIVLLEFSDTLLVGFSSLATMIAQLVSSMRSLLAPNLLKIIAPQHSLIVPLTFVCRFFHSLW